MHKITKGLKKKKKGKKSKRKEEELFKPEELEVYRKEHQGVSEDSTEKNEEWKKFIALTSGVDDILKKTQGDLDRIKSTSFFQRKPTESEVKSREKSQALEEATQQKEEKQEVTPQQLGIVELSESESEEEDDDNIFDTAYIDAIAAGEVKLAYIPESPTDKVEGDDPFDTSIAERAILGPEVQRKGKKLVPIGAAVEVLTGRVQLPTCATKRPTSKRQVLKERDLLLGSFDDNLDTAVGGSASPEEVQKTLLDDDPIPITDEPIQLIHSLNQPTHSAPHETVDKSKDIISEFDTIVNASDDPDDQEFEALAAESLSKSTKVLHSLPLTHSSGPADDVKWNAFEDKSCGNIDVDPFDTSFAENILPGKAELKLIENEILNDADFQFPDEQHTVNGVSIQITDTVGQRNIIQTENRVSESELNLIKPIHRDLLGGSNTDLSISSTQPQQLTNDVRLSNIGYSDPFDSSIADFNKQQDISLLERKLVAEDDLSDDDFDPRGEEKTRERTVSRPDVLNISGTKTVSFDVTSPKENELLGVGEGGKIIKPLTPFYIRKNSVPELPIEEDLSDPFDTSFASNIAPGKAELKVIESELFDPIIEKELSLVDNDFDPRDEKKAEIDKVVEKIKDISNVKLPTPPAATVDLLAIDTNISAKVLTPGERLGSESELSYCDPFDTSAVAGNILPGKTELKLLETELIHSENANLNSDKPIENLLENDDDIIIHRPLSPSESVDRFSSITEQEDFDPFDTSIANNIQPGRAELKLLESEFI